MAAKPTPAAVAHTPGPEAFDRNDPCGEHCATYQYLFAGWLILFMLVVCGSLAGYLLSFLLPRG